MPIESNLKMELGQLKTIDISAHVRALFRVVSPLGLGLKAFAYANTDAEVYFAAKTVD